MSISLYISNVKVEVAEGKRSGKMPQITRVLTVPMPQGVIDQGEVKDEKTFVRTLKEFWEEHGLSKKDISLTLNGRLVTTGMVEVPSASDKLTYSFVQKEMSLYEDTMESIYAWKTVEGADKKAIRQAKAQQKKQQRKNKQKLSKEELEFFASFDDDIETAAVQETVKGSLSRLLAGRMELAQIKRLIKLLKFAGIEISSVDDNLFNVVEWFGQFPQLSGESCIIQIYDGQSILSLLFIKGTYYYSSRSKIFEEPGTIGFAIAMARSVSGIIQFMQANSISFETVKVLLMGLDPEDILNCTDSILQMNDSLIVEDVDAAELLVNQTDTDLNSKLLSCAGLVQIPKTADFYPAYLREKKKEKDHSLLQDSWPIFVTAIVGILVTLLFAGLNISTRMKTNEMKAYNMRMEKRSMEYDRMLERAAFNEEQYNAIHEIRENADTYPWPNSKVEDIIKKTALSDVDVSVVSYESTSGLYNVKTTAKDVERINRYIERLRTRDTFTSVEYSGYIYSEETKRWQVNVMCYLHESAGKDEK